MLKEIPDFLREGWRRMEENYRGYNQVTLPLSYRTFQFWAARGAYDPLAEAIGLKEIQEGYSKWMQGVRWGKFGIATVTGVIIAGGLDMVCIPFRYVYNIAGVARERFLPKAT